MYIVVLFQDSSSKLYNSIDFNYKSFNLINVQMNDSIYFACQNENTRFIAYLFVKCIFIIILFI